jgi:PIN domain nuclease of toxin-antitoxin system
VILLLDAHAVLWALREPERLQPAVRSDLEDPANDVIVSAASIWELEIKRALGKLRFEFDLVIELERRAINAVPITAADAVTAARLPLHHRDPFDRMLVAQTRRLDAILVTRDAVFERYEVEILPA